MVLFIEIYYLFKKQNKIVKYKKSVYFTTSLKNTFETNKSMTIVNRSQINFLLYIYIGQSVGLCHKLIATIDIFKVAD